MTKEKETPKTAEQPKKKPYTKPVLRELGSVDKLTLGSSPPSARRKPQG